MESLIWVLVPFAIHNTTCPIKGATGCSQETNGAFHYFPFETLLALPIVNQQKNLLSQSEIHSCKVNPQMLNVKWKKRTQTFMVIFQVFYLYIYFLTADCLE